ncbi:MAG: DUF58 domain-containing protein [Myxococcales bacterium]|nr:DUF58 domain-containing protein [Myxococcales bacterium]
MHDAQHRPKQDGPLIRQRHAQVARERRKRVGFWRSLGRSNRLFPRKLIVTRDGKWIIAMSLLLGVGAVNTGNNLLYLVLSLLISIIAISGILSEMNLAHVKAVRRHPTELELGETTLLRTEVHNDKKRASFNIEVDEVVDDGAFKMRPGYVLHLRPHEVGQGFVAVIAQRRGPVVSDGFRITTAYPFGFARKSRIFEEPMRWLVLPRVAQLDWEASRGAGRGDLAHTRKKGFGSEFLGLRDWRVGEPTRDLHWKVSAKRGRLIAREWEEEATRAAWVEFVHVAPGQGDDPTLLDGACETVAGICASLLAEGMSVGLRTFAGIVVPEPDLDGGAGQLRRIQRLLAALVLADRPPPPRWPLEDAIWAARVRQAWHRHDALASGTAVPLSTGASSVVQERVRVVFASRADVRIDGPAATVDVVISGTGEIVSVTRADKPVRGAA